MKRILLTILIGACLQGFAQDELNKYRPVQGGIPKEKPVILPKEVAPKPDPPAVIEKPDPLKAAEAKLFKDPRLYKPDADGALYRRNQYLGGFKTKSFTSTIRYRDAAAIDGDKIKVYLNDKLIQPEVTMDGEYQGFKINLMPGINKIDFEALNEGFASPNTAEFQVYDDQGKIIESSQWNVGTGYKATVLLLKE